MSYPGRAGPCHTRRTRTEARQPRCVEAAQAQGPPCRAAAAAHAWRAGRAATARRGRRLLGRRGRRHHAGRRRDITTRRGRAAGRRRHERADGGDGWAVARAVAHAVRAVVVAGAVAVAEAREPSRAHVQPAHEQRDRRRVRRGAATRGGVQWLLVVVKATPIPYAARHLYLIDSAKTAKGAPTVTRRG